MYFTLVGSDDGDRYISVFIPGQNPLVAHSSHPNFDAIVDGVNVGDDSVAELFDIANTLSTKFERLTERVSVANGRLYLDNVEVHNSLADTVIRFLNERVDDWKPLVRFFENVQNNPNDHSREQLFTWMDERQFSITENGMIVGYKGVDKRDGKYLSTRGGKAIVNGEVIEGLIPQSIGDVVEMPRDEVAHNPNASCSTGLHVADYNYATSYGSTMLEVHVNPRDVVSVPTGDGLAKVRVCRYLVVGELDRPVTEAVRSVNYEWVDPVEWDDDEECEDCGFLSCSCDDDVSDEEFANEQIRLGNVMPVFPPTPKEYHAGSEGSIDNSWSDWNADSSLPRMTRDEFRDAVR